MWAWVFLLLSASFWTVFIYPYAIYPHILRFMPRMPIKKSSVDASISLLFCAYNEAESLPRKIANLHLLKERHKNLEILAFDDGSNDGTSEILAAAGNLLTVVKGGGRSGKAAGMKRLAAIAKGDILVFTDANVILAENALECILPYYGDPKIGGVCGTLVYTSAPDSVTSEVGSLYWQLDENLRSLESETGNVVGADGSIFSVRRHLYPTFPDTVLDDFTVSMSVVFNGYRLVKARDIIAFENSIANRSEELRRKIRIGARSYHTHTYLRPQIKMMDSTDRFKYYTHKFIRWYGGLFLMLGLIFALLAIASVSTQLAATVLLLIVLFGVISAFFSRGPPAQISEAILAIFATFIGVVKGMRGQTIATWAPAKSR